MALKSLTTFTAALPGVPTTLPHGISLPNGVDFRPDIAFVLSPDFTITATTATTITVVNGGGIAANCSILCELWHTIERFFPNGVSLSNELYVLASGTLVVYTPGGAGGALPPLSGVQYAVLGEFTIGVASWARLTEDMILPAFTPTVAIAAPTVAVVEIGDTVTNPNFTGTYNRPAALITMSDSDGGGPFPVALPGAAFSIVAAYTKSAVNAVVTFTLSANESGGPVKTATATITWEPLVFYGVAVDPGVYTEAFIEGLATSALDNNRQRTIAYNAAAGQSLFYSYPTSYGGTAANFTDAGTGFAAGFSKVGSAVSVTNTFGVAVTYDVWRSDQTGLGAVNIAVT